MIYLNGKPWEGYDQYVKSLFANKLPEFNKNLVFVVTGKYRGMRKMGKDGAPVAWKETTAASSPLPIEYQTFIDGKMVTLRYVSHIEQRVEQGPHGPVQIPIEHPGSMYIQDGKFEIKNAKKKFDLWMFLMLSPHCENGFTTDSRKMDGDATINIWGIKMKDVLYNIANRGFEPDYKYVDEAVIRKAKLNEKERVFKVQTWIMKEASEQELRDTYAALGREDSATDDIAVIKDYLYELAAEVATSGSNKPGYQKILDVDKKTVSYKSTVVRAEEAGVIRYAKVPRAWKFEGEEAETICLVPKGVNPVDALVEWLRTKDDGGQVFEKIKAGLKVAETAEV